MRRSELLSNIHQAQSCLCVGLDTDPDKLPKHLYEEAEQPMLAFNQAIIEATAPHCVAYKLNTAFYEAQGAEGWAVMRDTIDAIPDGKMVIADAKRGDIGNTAAQYAKAFFSHLEFDGITLSPYMGRDAIEPFLSYPDKASFVLVLTTNPGAEDFQYLHTDGKPVYEHVMATASELASAESLMFVVGGTRPEELSSIRRQYPRRVFLVPGVGSQGGTLAQVLENGLGADQALLVNVSRDILYRDSSRNFAHAAKNQAAYYHDVMRQYLQKA
jgi:orotidine-5'-phosphate decarboxylase